MKKISTYFYFFIATILSLFLGNKLIIHQTENQIYDNKHLIPYSEYALVLGAAKEIYNHPNPYFNKRLDAAVELYSCGKINKIIVSGDNHTANYNETEDMATYLIQKGIPETAIIKDFAGFRTLDSVVRAKKVFGIQTVTIISQKFHNQRALYIANYYKMDAIAYNAGDTGSVNYTHFREYLAKCWTLFDLHVFKRQPKFF